jgi:hypothetical protein
MGYNLRSGALSCWKCGTRGQVETLSALTGLDPEECRKILAGGRDGPRRPRAEPKPRGKYTPPTPLEDLGPVHRNYLKGRGFDPDELARLWGLKATTLCHRSPWSVVAPIHLGGTPVSWVSRRCSDRDKGARHNGASPEEESIARKTLLFAEDHCEHAIVVVEGVFDVFRIGPGAVATFGTSYSRSQIYRMSRYPVRVVCFDNEQEAQKRATVLAKTLESLPGKTYNISLDAKDPGCAHESEIKELRKQFLE